MKKIMVYSTKGGCGKSTSVLTVAKTCAKKGYKTLLIDCDSQANLSRTLLKETVLSDDYVSMTDIFVSKVNEEMVRKAIYKADENLDVIGSSGGLVWSELVAGSDPMCDRARILEKILKPLEDEYDVLLMDFNPYPSLIVTNGFVVCDYVMIPVTFDAWGYDGIAITLSLIGQAQEAYLKDIPFKVFLNMKGKSKEDAEFLEQLKIDLGEEGLFNTVVNYQAKPFKDKDVLVVDFKNGETTVGRQWKALFDEVEREVLK